MSVVSFNISLVNLLSLLFPTFCCSCGQIGNFLCAECFNHVYFLPNALKPRIEPNYLHSLQAATNYDEPIKSLIHQLKYQHVKDIGTFAARIIYQSVTFPDADLITSVPLHQQRQRDRGYNQAEVIAQEFARLTKVPYVPLLEKTHQTVAQAKIEDKQQRLQNLTSAYKLKPEFLKTIKPTRIILIDDVITTGTTLNQCAKVLKESGYIQVFGLALAHGV